jgi:UDPglucose--hexose-1-phosphate uridylyltransferase
VSDLLTDELTGDCVIIAPARAVRPDQFRVPSDDHAGAGNCPFCPGHEHETPPEVARAGPGAADTPGWRVRVVPNKFPIAGTGLPGAHEVVVLSPDHRADLGALDDAAAIDAVRMVRDRCAFHLAQGREHAQAFFNHGRASGASLPHPHAQLVALDVVPPRVQARLERFTTERFTRDRAHVVAGGTVAVWCPPASASPFAMRCALTDAGARFDELSDDAAAVFAIALRDTVARVHAVLGGAAYNVVIETAPRSYRGPFQWWADVVPRVTVLGGFEAGTGIYVNVVAPDAAAAALRDAGRA